MSRLFVTGFDIFLPRINYRNTFSNGYMLGLLYINMLKAHNPYLCMFVHIYISVVAREIKI